MSQHYRSTARLVAAWITFAVLAIGWITAARDPYYTTGFVLIVLALAIVALVWAIWETRLPRAKP